VRYASLGVAIEGARAAHAEHFLAVASYGPPEGRERLPRIASINPLLGGATGLDSLRCGLRFVVGELASDKGGPNGFQFFVVAIEHSFSVRDQVPPKGAHDFRQSSAAAKNGYCIGSRFRGYEGC
jgi:hypothetical protein